MTYPRYRIYLTSTRREDGDNNNKSNKNPFSLLSLSTFFASARKSQLEQEFSSTHNSVVWMEDKNGLDAFAALWRQSALLQDSVVAVGSSQDQSNKNTIVALPNCSRNFIRHWIEIMDWMKEEKTLWNKMPVIIDAVLLDNYKDVPVVELKARQQQSSINEPSTQQQQQQQSALAVSATTSPIINDANILEARMKSWVNRILVNQGICPFTKSVTKSGQGLADVGVPVARIAYLSTPATIQQIYHLMADTWEAIGDMMAAGPTGKTGVSSILFAAPAFDDDFGLWAGPIFAMLEAGVVAIGAERSIGVVCFHPRYATPDGTSWPGFGHMHSVPRLVQWYQDYYQGQTISPNDAAAGGAWQRRTPHATINVLRADQLAAAEGRRATGILYAENIQKLVGPAPHGIGSKQLTADLNRERNLML